jgi:signal transduction histidine kinase
MQLLEMDEGGNKRVKDSLDGIKEILTNFDEPNKLTMLILRNEPITYKNELVNISSIYDAILTKNKKVYGYSQIALEYNVEENIKTSGDEQKITQILVELLINASDSFENSEEGGKITVKVFVENFNCVISVEDTGFGMDYDLQRYLTTKFFTRKFKRPGLGLTRVRRFVEDWGGSLLFASKPEKGTSITVRFPIVL